MVRVTKPRKRETRKWLGEEFNSTDSNDQPTLSFVTMSHPAPARIDGYNQDFAALHFLAHGDPTPCEQMDLQEQ